MKFAFDWPSCFREEDVLKWWSYKCARFSPWTGADNAPVVIFFFIITIIKSSKSFASPLNDFVTIFPIQAYRRPNLTMP